MSFKGKIVGVVLSFLTVGTIATATDQGAYQEIYDEHHKQTEKIESALNSEFIGDSDSNKLEEKLEQFDEVKETSSRNELRELLRSEKQTLKEVEKNLVSKEKSVAKDEWSTLEKEFATLELKSQEKFVLKADIEEVTDLKEDVSQLKTSSIVFPIREASQKVADLSQKVKKNQEQVLSNVDELKKINESSQLLAKEKYVTKEEVTTLEQDRKNNDAFIKEADDLDAIQDRVLASSELVLEIEAKQKETAEDFKNHQEKTESLIKEMEKLLANGTITSEEKEELTAINKKMSNSLQRKDYLPGDLERNIEEYQPVYDEIKASSDAKIAEAKKKAEEKAKREAEERQKAEEQARIEEEKRQQAAVAEAQRQAESNTAMNQGQGEATYSGGWYQAPAGYKYLKSESGKTYGQVKNPGNFSLITESEAANYSPGHGNGSAKQ